MRIRQERPEDFEEIYRLVETAFRTAKMSDGDEQNFVNELRTREGYIPELALVAEYGGRLVGHVMLTRKVIAGDGGTHQNALMLAPLAVLLEHRSQGVGARLVEAAMAKAKEMGFGSVFLAGDPAYYSRFGFRESAEYNILNVNGIPDRFALAAELAAGALDGIRGTISLS